MKVFITGSTGLLGTQLLHQTPMGIKVGASYFENLFVPNVANCQYFYMDIRNRKNVFSVIEDFKPSWVIHTAAKASPDFCEKNKDEAHKVNFVGTKNIVDCCKKNRINLIYISTNQVFSGDNPPYDEDSQPHSINFYGKTKLEGEKYFQSSKLNGGLVRLMTMYGWNNPRENKNTASWVIEQLSQKQPIKVVDDICNNFLYAQEAASILWKMVKENFSGLIHIAGADILDRFNFALRVARTFSLDTSLISPVPKSYFTDEAARPKNTSYKLDKMVKNLRLKPLIVDKGLQSMRDRKPDKNYWILLESL